MRLLTKFLLKYEGEAYHSMSKDEWKEYKHKSNNEYNSSLIWSCALLMLIDIVLLILVLTRTIDHGSENPMFRQFYHSSLLCIFGFSIIILGIRGKKDIKWLRRFDAGFVLSIIALSFSVLYTVFHFNVDSRLVYYAIGLIFCVCFLRERPLFNTLIYLLSLAVLIIISFVLVPDASYRYSIIFHSCILALLTILISQSIFKHRMKSFCANEQLSRLVTIDSLTGLNNRFSYNKYISENSISCPAVICTFDMDNLKEINDTFGHLEGDKCLKAIAKSLSAAFEFSFLARIGGDEFVAILANSSISSAISKIVRFRDLIEDEAFANSSISVSLGYCILTKNEYFNEAFIKAENMMYAEKNQKKLISYGGE